jgi:hypothetical protein
MHLLSMAVTIVGASPLVRAAGNPSTSRTPAGTEVVSIQDIPHTPLVAVGLLGVCEPRVFFIVFSIFTYLAGWLVSQVGSLLLYMLGFGTGGVRERKSSR